MLRASATTFTIRREHACPPDMRVIYPVDMADSPVNREAWAAVVQKLLDEEAKGNKSALARMVGVEYQTIRRWLKAEVDVKEESVRSVARALNLRPMDLLVEVGYYVVGDVTHAAPEQVADEEALQLIDDADVTPSVKRELRKWVMAQRAEHERQRASAIQQMLELNRRRTA